MNINEIQNEWENDSRIISNKNVISTSDIISVPLLHSKYYNILNMASIEQINLNNKLNSKKFELIKYYEQGSSSTSVKEQKREWRANKTILKGEIDLFLNSEPEYQEILIEIEKNKIIISYLNSIIKVINDMQYMFNNYNKLRAFENT